MNRPIIPTQSDRQKLARLWAWYEAFAKRGSPATTPYDQPAQGQPTPGAGGAHAEPIRFFARITAATQDGANDRWVYDWLQIEKTGAGYDQWGDVEGGYSGTAAASTGAYNLPEDQGSATELATGSRVQIEIVPVWDESAAVESEYWIVGGADGPPNVFPVKVGVDGGDQGTDSAPATYTYTVQSLDGTELGTEVEVVRPRPNGAVTCQVSSAGGYGLAFYDGATLKLWDAGEIPQTYACP
jgi:hypothetical protein